MAGRLAALVLALAVVLAFGEEYTEYENKAWRFDFKASNQLAAGPNIPRDFTGWVASESCHPCPAPPTLMGGLGTVTPTHLGLRMTLDNNAAEQCDSPPGPNIDCGESEAHPTQNSHHWRGSELQPRHPTHYGVYTIVAKMPHYNDSHEIPKAYWFLSLWSSRGEQIYFQWSGGRAGSERYIYTRFNYAKPHSAPNPHNLCPPFHLPVDPRTTWVKYVLDWKPDNIIWSVHVPNHRVMTCEAVRSGDPRAEMPTDLMEANLILRANYGYDSRPVYAYVQEAAFEPHRL